MAVGKVNGKPAAQNGKAAADVDDRVVMEFGGPIGTFLLMVFSHVTVYYIWICLEYYGGSFVHPTSWNDVGPFARRMWAHVVEGATPTWSAAAIYFGFLGLQALLAVTMPGIDVKGLPIASEGGRQLVYRCNGVASWYATLAIVAALHYYGVFSLSQVLDQFGPIMSVAAIASDAISVLAYVSAVATGNATRMSGNVVYDIFMGAWLNPRIGTFDLKFWGELRVAWIMLFLLTASAAVKQYETLGYIGYPMVFMLLAHGLYTNACMKGEECVPTTWDLFYEKWGWMLIFWNFCGVPFVYCAQARYIHLHGIVSHGNAAFTAALFATLLIAYYIWDTAQSQRNRFRMMLRGTYVKRYTFPQLPWGTLEFPTYLRCDNGGTLLTDGWWRFARKIHYTMDIIMALTWGLDCGTDHFLPYFYVAFFTVMIIHRYFRDAHRCAEKYGADWERYCKLVPYIFIPFVF